MQQKPTKNKVISLIIIILSITAIVVFATVVYTSMSIGKDVFGQDKEQKGWLGNFTTLANTINPFSENNILKTDGRTNALLLGKDSNGEGLTDSIILMSYYHEDKKLVSVNIPRDFYVVDKLRSGKINAIYSTAQNSKKTTGVSGGRYLADLLGRELQIDIHYWAIVDFEGVEKGVDELGGIEVEVPNSFRDCRYPNPGYRGYMRPCPVFEEGTQLMDGKEALIYARSRNGNNGEGSDFARSRRQSLVIKASMAKAKQKVTSGEIILSPQTINSYLNIFRDNLKTSVKIEELLTIANLAKEIKSVDNSYFQLNWQTGNGLLCDGSTPDGAYIIRYCDQAVIGTKKLSTYRERARKQIKFMLMESQKEEIFEKEIVLLSNLSDEAQKAYKDLIAGGYPKNKITYNKKYPEIPKATATSQEKISIYIPDEPTRKLFKYLKNDITFGYRLKTEIPTNLPLDKDYQEADIIIWVDDVDSEF